MSSESGPKFRVAICGAGVGGLVLAITIGKYAPSIPIDLYEARDSVETSGVGISIWKQVHEVMIELGLYDDFKQIFTRNLDDNSGFSVRRSGIQGGYLWYHRFRGNAPSAMHRQHMVAVLEKHLPTSCTVHPGKRLVNYIEREEQDAHSILPIRLEFNDGTTATADILVGADGIRSAVRKTLFETAAAEDNGDQKTDLKEYIDATFTGILIYRFMFPAGALRKENPEHRSLKEITAYCGNGGYMVSYPVAQGTLINVVAYFGEPGLIGRSYEGHWVADGTRDEVVDRFSDFEPDVRTMFKLCEKPSKWALHTVKLLPFCVRKRVALIGDACHGMTPHFGAGAGQAIDDAFVLGRLIAHPLMTLSRIPDALQVYEQVRLPFAQHLMNISLSTGRMYLFMEPGYYDGTKKEEDLDDRGIGAYEREGMETMKQEILRRWDWIDNSRSGLQQWEEAESKLQALVVQVTN